MKKLALIGALFIVGWAASVGADSPGTPGPSRYTLADIYDYLNSGTAAAITGHTLEPPEGAIAGDIRFKTLNQLYEDIKSTFERCTATSANVEPGVTFFCTRPGSWGLQTGTYATPTPAVTPTPTLTPTTTPATWYEEYGPTRENKVVQIGSMYVAKWTNNEGTGGDSAKTWQDAMDWAAALVWLGQDDWRLPSSDLNWGYNSGGEIRDIYNARESLGAYEPNRYWTSLSYREDAAVGLNFSNGYMDGAYKVDALYVRVVRP